MWNSILFTSLLALSRVLLASSEGCLELDQLTEEPCMNSESSSCKMDKDTVYEKNTTWDGIPCQKWSEDSPYSHEFNHLGQDNFCRNPDGEPGPWCYTTSADKRFELCYKPCEKCLSRHKITNEVCTRSETGACKSLGRKMGKNSTVAGIPCQVWTASSPHSHGYHHLGDDNFCYDSGESRPWCYSMDPEIRWDYCYRNCNPNGNCAALPVPREHGPDLKVVSQRVWEEHGTGCEPGVQEAYYYATAFHIAGVKARVEPLPLGVLKVTIENETPRAFQSLKIRVQKMDEAKSPVEFEIQGPFNEFTTYEHDLVLSSEEAILRADEVKSVSVILPNQLHSASIRRFESECGSVFKKKYVATPGQRQKTISRIFGDIHFLANQPEFRKFFFFGPAIGLGWTDRAKQFDYISYEKTKLRAGVVNTGYAGLGGGSWFSVYYPGYNGYDYGYPAVANGLAQISWHEMAHGYGYSHSDRVLLLQDEFEKVATKLNEECVLQTHIAPLERYNDNVAISAVLNPKDGLVSVFSAYSFRTFNMKEVPIRKDQTICVNKDETCAWSDLSVCKRLDAYSGQKATTVDGEACKPWNETRYKSFPENFCRSSSGAPWCYKESGDGWAYCFKGCETPVAQDTECLETDSNTGEACFQPWNEEACRDKSSVYPKNTTKDGVACQPWDQDSPHKHGHNDLGPDSLCRNVDNELGPWCYTMDKEERWEYCYPICNEACVDPERGCVWKKRDICMRFEAWDKDLPACYEPSDDERVLVEKRFPEITTGVKYAFLTAEEDALVLVPFHRGQAFQESQAYVYSLETRNGQPSALRKTVSLASILNKDSLLNPQFLQGYGAFLGSKFCDWSLSSCSSVFTNSKLSFLKRFSSGPADVDLVFNGGDGNAYFFKGKEYLVVDLEAKKMREGFPRPTSEFLEQLGLSGETVYALS